LLAFAGGLIALWRRGRTAAWLIPPVALLASLLWSVFNGSLVPKSSYTVTAGTMVLPFTALVFQQLGVERWRAALVGAAAVVTAGVVAVGSCERCFNAAGLQALRGTSPVPRFENQALASELAEIVVRNLTEPPAGVVTDFYGYDGTDWVLLLARIHPDRIFVAPWGPHQPLDEERLAAFAQARPEGLLIMRPGSRFARQIGLDAERGVATLAGQPVRIEEVAGVAWPENDWHPLAPDDVGEERIVVYRYGKAEISGRSEGAVQQP
jgi:hypothetical protein